MINSDNKMTSEGANYDISYHNGLSIDLWQHSHAATINLTRDDLQRMINHIDDQYSDIPFPAATPQLLQC